MITDIQLPDIRKAMAEFSERLTAVDDSPEYTRPPQRVVAKRRAKNKQARRSRKANR